MDPEVTIDERGSRAFNYFVISWPVNVDIETAFDSSYEFGETLDATLPVANGRNLRTIQVKSQDRGYVELAQTLIGVVAYSSRGGTFVANDDHNDGTGKSDLETYSTWKNFYADLCKIKAFGRSPGGFRIGFRSCDIVYMSVELLRRRKLNHFANSLATMRMFSHYNLKSRLPNFIEATSPGCGTKALEELVALGLEKLPR